MDMSAVSHQVGAASCEIFLESFTEVAKLPSSNLPRATVHILDSNAADRAKTFRLFSDLDYHCEIYSTLTELIKFQPSSGILIVHERPGGETITEALKQTHEAGLALTIVGCSKNPSLDIVISAMKAGARHYFELPFVSSKVAPVLTALTEVNRAEQKTNELRASALVRLRGLSARERQVVELMVSGKSNKAIARLLTISPRTVEIHRMKAMAKLGAQNASDAVRIWLIGTERYGGALSPMA